MNRTQPHLKGPERQPNLPIRIVEGNDLCEVGLDGRTLMICNKGDRPSQEDHIVSWDTKRQALVNKYGHPWRGNEPLISLTVADGRRGKENNGVFEIEPFVRALIPDQPDGDTANRGWLSSAIHASTKGIFKRKQSEPTGPSYAYGRQADFVYAAATIGGSSNKVMIEHSGNSKAVIWSPNDEAKPVFVAKEAPGSEVERHVSELNKGWPRPEVHEFKVGEILLLMSDGCHKAIDSKDLLRKMALLSEQYSDDAAFSQAVQAALISYQRAARVTDNFSLIAYAHNCTLREALRVWRGEVEPASTPAPRPIPPATVNKTRSATTTMAAAALAGMVGTVGLGLLYNGTDSAESNKAPTENPWPNLVSYGTTGKWTPVDKPKNKKSGKDPFSGLKPGEWNLKVISGAKETVHLAHVPSESIQRSAPRSIAGSYPNQKDFVIITDETGASRKFHFTPDAGTADKLQGQAQTPETELKLESPDGTIWLQCTNPTEGCYADYLLVKELAD